jgi:predicted secreted protein
VRGTVLALLLLSLGLGDPAAAVAQDVDQRATVLHLSQTAERTLARDLLRVELRVEETGPDPRAVQSAINRRMTAALDRARQAESVRVETGSYHVGEERPTNRAAIWRGSQSLILKSKNADATLKLVGALQSDGLSTASLGYEVSPETVRSAQDDLTTEALAALDRRAASVAEATHLAVLRYRDLRVGNAETEGRPVPRFGGAAMAAGAPPVAEPGEAVVRVTVEAELLLGSSRP